MNDMGYSALDVPTHLDTWNAWHPIYWSHTGPIVQPTCTVVVVLAVYRYNDRCVLYLYIHIYGTTSMARLTNAVRLTRVGGRGSLENAER